MYRFYICGPLFPGPLRAASFMLLDNAIEYSCLLLSAMRPEYYILILEESSGNVVWDSREALAE